MPTSIRRVVLTLVWSWGLAPAPSGNGYRLAGSDGDPFTDGNALLNRGDLGGMARPALRDRRCVRPVRRTWPDLSTDLW